MSGQRGLALIMALLVVALTAAIAASFMRSDAVWFKETRNIRLLSQARAVMDGAFRFAAVEVTKDSSRSQIDALTGRWAQPLPWFPVAGGTVRAALVDPEGRFNINDLVVAGRPVPAAVTVFTRLLRLVGLDPALAQALIAWELPAGSADAELDAVYLGRRTPYRAGQQRLSGMSELRLVLGFSAKSVRALRPYVTALPQVTPININTAPALVLAALCPGLGLRPAGLLAAQAPYTSTAAFQAALPPGSRPIFRIVVQTHYFLVYATARFGGLVARRRALLYRPARGQTTAILWQEALWRHRHTRQTGS